jgi:Lon protease-like protein
MAAFHPRLGDLPTEFAVFPLTGALLLPRGKLPLNIFERRYLTMVLDSLGTGRMFGMIQPDSHAPAAAAQAVPPQASPPQASPPQAAHSAEEPGLYRVGCLGRLSSFSETDDGRLLITLTGLIRFTVDAERDKYHGYRRIRGDFSHYTDDLALTRPSVDIERDKLLAALRGYFARRSVDVNWDAIKGLSDDALVITLAMACPFEPVEKQALLEAPADADRAATLLALLQMGAASPDLPPGHSVS